MGGYVFSMRAIFLLLVMAIGNLLLLPLATAQDAAMELIRQMIAIASENGGVGREDELSTLKQKIDALPKPERGNRRAAQKENEKGLAAINAKDYEQAKRYFLTARQLDPGSPEIANNLGFVYLKLGDYQQAMRTLVETITLSPGRANAWVNLGEYFAVRDKTQQAVACYALTYHFSQNRDKTRRLFQEQSTAADDLKVRQTIQQALQLSLIQGGGDSVAKSLEDFLTAPKPSNEPTTPPVAKAPVATPDAVPAQPTAAPLAQTAPVPEPAGKPDGVHACDRYAAHPADPTLPDQSGLGVSDEALDAESAIKVCQSVAGEQPDVPRFKFQLGRALMKADRIEDAIEQFVSAAEQGHGGALAYLGDLHLGGAPGIEADPVLARSLFEKAVEAGFMPAKTILDQFEDYTEQLAQAEQEEQAPLQPQEPIAELPENPSTEQVTNSLDTPLDSSGYNYENVILLIYSRDFDNIPEGEDFTKIYLLHVAENIAQTCNAHFTLAEVEQMNNRFGLKQLDFSSPEAALTGGLGQILGIFKDPQKLLEAARSEKIVEQLPITAMQDAFTLMRREPCNSVKLERFSQNLRAFVNDEGAPALSMRDWTNICMQQARGGRYGNRQFCSCFVGAMRLNPVTRGQKKALATNFWPTAQSMMRNNSIFANCYGRS